MRVAKWEILAIAQRLMVGMAIGVAYRRLPGNNRGAVVVSTRRKWGTRIFLGSVETFHETKEKKVHFQRLERYHERYVNQRVRKNPRNNKQEITTK